MLHRTVQDVMTHEVATVRRDTPFKTIAQLLAKNDVTAVPVVDGQHPPIGIVSDSDLLRGLAVIRQAPPDATQQDERWIGLYGDDPHDLDLPGMLASVVGPLGSAGVPVFVASTFHSDLVLVPQTRLTDATTVLRAAGHTLVGALAGPG